MAAVDGHQFFKYKIKHAIYAGLLFHINIDAPKKKKKNRNEKTVTKIVLICLNCLNKLLVVFKTVELLVRMKSSMITKSRYTTQWTHSYI